jgi:predicted amidophosphoribosyltransferase
MKDKKERLANMKDVFAVNKSAAIQGADVVLFDDVFTTGATMRAACTALKKAGARRIWALTMAR